MTVTGSSTARFYYSMPSPCPYLEGRMERRIFVDLTGPQAVLSYDLLSEAGFRRSLGFAYRPACPGCNACVAVRIPVARFRLTRQWRRVFARNADVSDDLRPATATRSNTRCSRATRPAGTATAKWRAWISRITGP